MTSGAITCSTHVLDVALGAPAVGLQVELGDPDHHRLASGTTDADGRVRFDVALEAGSYVLTFATGDWFTAAGRTTYFPTVVVAFVAAEDQQHHHVPLLLSPFSYTTYRGT